MSQTIEEIVAEVEAEVLEKGGLTKAHILRVWQLDEDAYSELKKVLLTRRRVDLGPLRIGGFRAKPQRETLPPETDAGVLLADWEGAAAKRLAELLEHKELEDLLGDLAYTVRESRRLASGTDKGRRGTKSESAAALIVQHGRARRRLLSCGADRWRPYRRCNP